jgi:hypothetical protein
VILTPHCAEFDHTSAVATMTRAVDNVLHFLRGEPLAFPEDLLSGFRRSMNFRANTPAELARLTGFGHRAWTFASRLNKPARPPPTGRVLALLTRKEGKTQH